MKPHVFNQVMGHLQDMGAALRKKRLQDRVHGHQGEDALSAPRHDNLGGDGHPMNHVPEDRHLDTETTLSDSETRAGPGVINPPRPEPGDAKLTSPELGKGQKDHTKGTTDLGQKHNLASEANDMEDGAVDRHGAKLDKSETATTPSEPPEGQNSEAPYGMHALKGMLDELGSAEEVEKPSKGLHQSQDLNHVIAPGAYKVKAKKKGYVLRRKKG